MLTYVKLLIKSILEIGPLSEHLLAFDILCNSLQIKGASDNETFAFFLSAMCSARALLGI